MRQPANAMMCRALISRGAAEPAEDLTLNSRDSGTSWLAREARRLQTPAEIERLARVQFNMVFPGEQAYNVISPAPASNTTTTLP